MGLALLAAMACAKPAATASTAQATNAEPTRPAAGAFVRIDDAAYGAYRFAPEAPTLGERAPEIEALTSTGAPFVLSDALATSRVVLLFYRGDW